MQLDWSAIGFLAFMVGMLYTNRQQALNTEKAMNTLVEQNREDHKELFHRQEREAVARIEGDSAIREAFVRIEDCDRRHAQRRSGTERRRNPAPKREQG